MQVDAGAMDPGYLPTEIASQVRLFITRSLEREVADTEELFRSRIATSLFGFQLMLFIENAFSIAVTDDDLVLDNFSCVENITRFVTLKRRQQAPGT